MAKYWEDFSDYAVGDDPTVDGPARFTERWHTGAGAVEIVSNANAPGGKAMRLTLVGFNRYFLSYDPVDSDPDRADAEVKVLVDIGTATLSGSNFVWASVRGSGTDTTETAYVANAHLNSGVRKLRLTEYLNGAASTLYDSPTLGNAYSFNSQFWLTIRADGSNLTVSTQEDETPGTNIDASGVISDNSIINGGWVGTGAFSHGNLSPAYIDILAISIGTGSDRARYYPPENHVANVTIDNTQVSADLTDFPVYIDLSDLPSSFWNTVANGGGDIRVFKSDGTTELTREVVSCDTATETGELHVLYSGTLSSSVDTVIQIYADGSSSDYAVGATYGRNAVWPDYGLVMHMADNTDSTGNNTVGEVGTPTYSGSEAVLGTGDYWEITSPSGLDLSDGYWLSFEASFSSITDWDTIINSPGTANGWVLQRQLASNNLIIRHDNVDVNLTNLPSFFTTGVSKFCDIRYQDSTNTIGVFVDTNVEKGSAAQTSSPASPLAALRLFHPDWNLDPIKSLIIKNGYPDYSLVVTSYNNKSNPSTFYTAEAVGAPPSSVGGYYYKHLLAGGMQ